MKAKDHYYYKAKEEGYASRAAYKLLEIQKTHKLFKPGDYVIELGAAPGGGTEIIAKAVGSSGKVIAVDLQAMLSESAQIICIQGDFTNDQTIAQIKQNLADTADVVVSDALPSTSGIHIRDAARSAELCLSALSVAAIFLKPGGCFLCKIFAGDEERVLSALRQYFSEVQRLKPDASKKRSREFYILCRSFKNGA